LPSKRISKPLALLVCGLAAAAVAGVALGAIGRAHVEPIVVTAPSSSTPTNIRLHGVVGPGFTISLGFDADQPVINLSPGTYTLTVDDLSNIHDFHLFGPGVDMATTVPELGTSTWTVALQPGKYTFVCDPHATTMIGTFVVLPYGTVTSYPAPKPTKKKRS